MTSPAPSSAGGLTTPDPVILDAIRKVARDEVAVHAHNVDVTGVFPHDSYQALAQAGLAELLIPAEQGGQGASTVTYAAAMEEIAAACGSTSTVYMTQMHCAHPIRLAGSPDQQRRFLGPLCRGEIYGAIAVTEPDAGSDVAAISTTARRDEDSYVLNGQKIFISNGDLADVVVLFATVDRQAGRDGITAFLVERGMAGFSTGRPIHKLGQRGASTVELFLSDCRVPVSNLLGPEGSGYALSIRSVMKSRISAAAQGIGFARAAYERAAAYFAERGMLSATRRDAQDVQFALADMKTRIEAARALLHQTAVLVDRSDTDPGTEVAMTKLHCTDIAVSVASDAVALLGEDGDRLDLGVERQLRDAKVTQIYDGTNQVQRMLIARDIRRAHS